MTQNDRLALAKELVTALEAGDDQQADQILAKFTAIEETELYREVGRLTRQLHDAFAAFTRDSRLGALANQEIPDAKERLHYVISMTEQAANQTLNVVDDLVPVADQMNDQAVHLAEEWARFLERKMPFAEFQAMTHQLTGHFQVSNDSLQKIRGGLNDILMAQSFQDISSQIIRRVIGLVEELENNLVELIRVAKKVEPDDAASAVPELPGPVVPGIDDKYADVAQSQDDVDDLLSSLGF
ncbi:MAG: protein phosphatase CheZ [Methylococcales bacterium]|nr:protein phosphatase CheZ [Methylococcales bacterium]